MSFCMYNSFKARAYSSSLLKKLIEKKGNAAFLLSRSSHQNKLQEVTNQEQKVEAQGKNASEITQNIDQQKSPEFFVRRDKVYKNPFPDLPALQSLDDPNYSKYLLRTLASPSALFLVFKAFGDEFLYMVKDLAKRAWRRPELDITDTSPNSIKMLYTFQSDKDMSEFNFFSDSSLNRGHSTASLVRTQTDSALFSGHIVKEPIKSGNVKRAGYAMMISKKKISYFKFRARHDFTDFTHLVLKLRGDGRTYMLILTMPFYYKEAKGYAFHLPLYTRGGPYWQISKIPFNDFYLTQRGRVVDKQYAPPDLHAIGSIGICTSNETGPFKLEIDYIGLQRKPYNKKETPYETYTATF